MHVTFVCFEKHIPKQEEIIKVFGQHERLKSIFLHRYPFLGKISLTPAISNLNKLLKTLNFDQITARGPLAGCVRHVESTLQNKKFRCTCCNTGPWIMRTRIYRYSSQKGILANIKNLGFKVLWDKLVFKSLEKIEKSVYKTQTSKFI